MGVLLCKGSILDKARTLFAEWDLDISGYVSDEDIMDMLVKMYRIAADLIPITARECGRLLGPAMMSSERADAYREKLINDVPRASQRLKSTIIGAQKKIDWQPFLEKFIANENLCTAAGLRQFL
jgi:hypothetical protein